MPPPLRAKTRGSTMMEILVAILVLGLGLLGFAGLHARSLANTHSAYLRSQATILTHDAVERMRVNRAAAKKGSYNTVIGSVPAGGSVAGDDLAEWKQNLGQALPGGDGSITVDGNSAVTITLRWNERRDGTPTTFTTQTTF
ncbi:type IV pilus modification protein PilV [Crenobacter cavernae]|uniref:Type IV pilus modification protein PilV n=2 Tax=Crenobacter cavernae TaxID=2290923 RepID=A0A345YAG9_9NEIS|nr:type IV pilus modification protein PilV [Crenobacter cavernae]